MAVIQRMLDVRGEDADRIEREHDPGPPAQARDRQTDRARNLAPAGQNDRKQWHRHPEGEDSQEEFRAYDMYRPRAQISDDEQSAQEFAERHFAVS